MKIYTTTGDRGETGLLGGIRVSKSHPAIAATGSLDETNSLIGLALAELQAEEVHDLRDPLLVTQKDLFEIGSRVAACLKAELPAGVDLPSRVQAMEQTIDHWQEQLPELTSFILPGGSRAGAALHVARTVCRHAERDLVNLVQAKLDWPGPAPGFEAEQVFLNRLSDFLFVAARLANHRLGQPETRWLPERSQS